MEKPKASIIWKTADCRAKWGENWDSRILVVHIWRTFDFVTFKIILVSFGALAIFRDWGLMITDRRKY